MKKFILLTFLILISCNKQVQDTIKPQNKYLIKAKICRDNKNLDSAYIYYTRAKEELLKIPDSTEAARAITNIAIIECDKGNYYGSIKNSVEAEKLLSKKSDTVSKTIAAANYNSIAIASKNLKNYSDAITYYKLAVASAVNKVESLAYNNNIGDNYLEQNNLELAKIYFQKALLTPNSLDYARALNNLAKVKFLENENYNALPELYKAWKIRTQKDDKSGINSSLATLADYYLKTDKSKSLFFAEEMYKVASKNKSPDDRLEALSKLITLDPKNYFENFKKYISLSDSIQTDRNNNSNKFALLQFDVEKIKRQNAENETFIIKQKYFSALLILALIISIIWYIKRQKTLKRENELKIKDNQLKISKKVHDVVANGIYHVMAKIENQEDFNKEETLDELEFVYEKSRDISYEKDDAKSKEDFNERVSNLIASFKNDTVNTYVAGNSKEIWNGLKESAQEEVFQIIRELLVNMKKHSGADRVAFKFERENNLIKIFYTDNGIGISGDMIYKNGLSSTVSRIETIHGEITFDTKTEKGLKISISFPVS
ncbi:ATP-binding protein [Chryseobacterium sp. H1D6B]|uniref:tetratricopeptide repeat-containing sensor histidine kinase n=1 Tax=Chryseobacterium sp. H1D6B TaxID=2940588 RepID=UPI0015C85A2E|nr:ATP-binding protein [Chryseobacterium sp. H1D6B]